MKKECVVCNKEFEKTKGEYRTKENRFNKKIEYFHKTCSEYLRKKFKKGETEKLYNETKDLVWDLKAIYEDPLTYSDPIFKQHFEWFYSSLSFQDMSAYFRALILFNKIKSSDKVHKEK